MLLEVFSVWFMLLLLLLLEKSFSFEFCWRAAWAKRKKKENLLIRSIRLVFVSEKLFFLHYFVCWNCISRIRVSIFVSTHKSKFFFSSSTSSSAVRNNEWRKYLFLRCYFYEIFVVFWFYFFGFSSRTETANEFNWDIQNAIYSIETVISFALIGFRFPFMEFIKYFFRKHLFTKKKKEIFTRCST